MVLRNHPFLRRRRRKTSGGGGGGARRSVVVYVVVTSFASGVGVAFPQEIVPRHDDDDFVMSKQRLSLSLSLSKSFHLFKKCFESFVKTVVCRRERDDFFFLRFVV